MDGRAAALLLNWSNITLAPVRITLSLGVGSKRWSLAAAVAERA